MFVATEEEKKTIPDKGYELYRVPTGLELGSHEADKWGYYSLLRIKEIHRNQSKVFARGKEMSDVHNGHYFGFVDRMYSHYEGTWSGGSVDYINKQYGEENVLPARLISYPVIRNKIDWVVGQFESAPLDIHLSAVDEQAIDNKTMKKGKMMFKKLMLPFIENLEQETGQVLEEDKTLPPDIDKFMRLTDKQIDEVNMTKLIKYNFHKYAWMNEISKAAKDVALLGFAFMKCVRVNNQDLAQRKCNAKDMIFDWGVENDFGRDTMFIGEERSMTPDQFQREFNLESAVMQEIKDNYKWLENGGVSMESEFSDSGHFQVTELNWKASTSKYYKKSPNKKVPGHFIYKEVTNDKKERDKAGNEIIKVDKYHWYSSIMVGESIVINTRMIDNPQDGEDMCDSIGEYSVWLFNRLERKPNGFAEMIEGLGELFNEVMFALELEVATSPGKIIEYDERTKPKGVPMTDVFYHMKANKVIQTNRSKMGLQAGGALSSYDLSPTAADTYINILMFIEGMIDRLTGITKMAQGDVPKDTYVGVMNQSIQQSNYITKPYYTFFKEGVRQMFRRSATFIKQMNDKKSRKLALILGETGAEMFVMDGKMPFGEYDFFFNDGQEMKEKREMLIDLGKIALQSGMATFVDLKNIILKDDIREISAELDRIAEEAEKKQQQMSQMEAQAADADRMAPIQLEQLKGQMAHMKEEMKKSFDEQIAKIYSDSTLKTKILDNEAKK